MHERGAIVVGWLAKLVVGLAIFGVIGFDAIAIMASHVSLTDDADSAAEAANRVWVESHGNVQAAYDAALAVATEHNAQAPVTDFSVTRDGTVHLRLTRTATTILVKHIGPLKKEADVSAVGEAQTPAS